MTPIRPMRSYRVRLVPADLPADQVEHAARCGQLRTLRLRAPSATWAERSARAVTDLRVYDVTRLEPAAEPSGGADAAPPVTHPPTNQPTNPPEPPMRNFAQHYPVAAWAAAIAIAFVLAASAALLDAPSEEDMLRDTAAALQDAIDQAQRERPDLWTDEQAARARHAVTLAARGEVRP